MTSPSFDPSELEPFNVAYPEQPVRIRHQWVDHPLMELDELAKLAGRMRPCDVEYYPGDTPFGIDPTSAPGNGLSVQETIRRIEDCGSWMVLKFIAQDELYRNLLLEALEPLQGVVGAHTGEMLKHQGFIFITSPGSVTPLHFDPEHNILLQIRGTKTMTIFPADDERFSPAIEHERFHSGGHRNLPWREEFREAGQPFDMTPGDAVHVPFMAPHFVQNGPGVSVSLSITWRSEWSYREEYAFRMNNVLRKAGMNPRRPHRFPRDNHLKSLSFRAIDKARRLTGRAP
jgi:Cupin-like domain